MAVKVFNVNQFNSYNRAQNQNLRVNSPYNQKKSYSIDTFTAAKNNSISINDGLKYFSKGLVSPITGMFKSVKSFALGIGTIAASTALVVATGGAAAPLLVAAGLGIGAVQTGKAASMLLSAKTKKQKENALFEAGAATGTIGLSVAGAKTSLKQASIETENLGALSASLKTIKSTPEALKGSYSAFKEGFYKENVKSYLKLFDKKPYQTSLSNSINKNVNENFEHDVSLIKNMLPKRFRNSLNARIKSQSSTYDKLINRSKFEQNIKDILENNKLTEEQKTFRISQVNKDRDLFYSNEEYAKSKVDDQCGVRLETNANVDDIVHSLAKSINNDDFDVVCIKNYRNPQNENSFYFSKQNIEELQDAGVNAGKEIDVKQDIKKSGYCSAQIKIRFKSGVLGEMQIRGKKVGEIAELEHIRYDLNSNKDIFKGNTELIKLFSPYKKALKNLSPEQINAYNKYFVDMYEWGRNFELGIKSKKPVLPEGLDKKLSIDNLKKLHNTLLQKGELKDKNYNLLPEISFLYGISNDSDVK